MAALVPVTETAAGVRRFAPIVGLDQFLRCGHEGTAIDARNGIVTLARRESVAGNPWGDPVEAEPAGLAFDRNGCLYHGVPEHGQVQRVAWRAGEPRSASQPSTVDLLAPAGAQGGPPVPGGGVRPVALAADADDHLFLLDGVTAAIHVLDLVDGRLLRTITLPWRPVDLAGNRGRRIHVATDDPDHPLLAVEALGHPIEVEVAEEAREGIPPAARPSRVAVGPDDQVWLLYRDDPARAWAVPVRDDRRKAPVRRDGAVDLELDGEGSLVFAGPPDGELQVVVLSDEGDTEGPALRARAYDGRGLVRTPDGRIGFWAVGGFRLATTARARFGRKGHVDGHRLDGGAYRQQWGRIFVEACIPRGTSVRVAVVTTDDDELDRPRLPRNLPAGFVPDPEEPPIPDEPTLAPQAAEPELAETLPLYRRPSGCELPWVSRSPGDRFEVYEAPVHAPPGRFLWVRVVLEGPGAHSPQVRAVRVEVPGHDLLRRLPRTYRRDPTSAAFLQRYLAMVDAVLHEMEVRADARDVLHNPHGTPAEALPWLASLIGLTLDDRWSEAARRQLVAEALCLFRYRGTTAALCRLLWLYLGVEVQLLEAWRFRGAGGGLTGGAGAVQESRAVVGHGLRVGGAVGEQETSPLAGEADDAFATHAHRFTVIIPRDLDAEQSATVQDILDLHRPAHTVVEVCTARRGLRVGVGLHLGISTLVGPSAGFQPATLDESRLGTDAVLGRPRAGVRVGGGELGRNTVVDP